MVISEKPSREELKQQLVKLENEVSSLRKVQKELEIIQQENFETTLQMETAIERANKMAAEAEIANLEFRQIFNTVADATWVIDRQQKVLRANQAFYRLIGKEENDVVGHKCSEILKSSLCGTPRCPMKEVINSRKSVELDMEFGATAETLTPYLLTVTPFFGFEGKPIGILSIFKDITERKKMEAELQKANQELTRLPVIDGLTQIANRRHFDDTLLREWKRMSRDGKMLSLVLCDVDYFKPYNDDNGHQMGDECLRKVAACLESNAKRASDLAARYGGEEFAVILPDTDLAGAEIVAQKIRTGVEKLGIAHQSSTVSSFVTLSLGIATFLLPRPDGSPEELISIADNALYQAKSLGRNRCVVGNG